MGARQIKSTKSDAHPDEAYKVLLMGLDNSGKSTFLYMYKFNQVRIPIPSIGFHIETLKLPNGVTLTVHDLNGGKNMLPLWKDYFQNIDGAFYVVDCNDQDRIKESAELLHSIVLDKSMHKVPIVILANKTDLPQSLTGIDLIERMNLSKLSETSNVYCIQATSALRATGIQEAVRRLEIMIKENKD